MGVSFDKGRYASFSFVIRADFLPEAFIQVKEASAMQEHIRERAVEAGKIILEERITIREIAKRLKVSKSTIALDLAGRLPAINAELASGVREVLDYHNAIKHLRGGEATKVRFRKKRLWRYV